MSAWDVAGAAVWTPLAILNTWALICLRKEATMRALVGGFSFSAAFIFAAVFCIARICGAPQ